MAKMMMMMTMTMDQNDEAIVYLNGDYLPLKKAKISPLDRGFLFGDAVYDTFPIYLHTCAGFDDHFARLQESLARVNIASPFNASECQHILLTLFGANQGENQTVYIQITRGEYLKRTLYTDNSAKPTVFAMSSPLVHASIETLEKGICATLQEDTRSQLCHTKSTSLMPSVLLRQQAHDMGFEEAILIKDGFAIEGTISNLMIVKDECIITPPLSNQLLSGTTRKRLLQLVQEKTNWQAIETPITIDELKNADEVWLTGTRREISPVLQIDNQIVSDGKAGPIWREMISILRKNRY